MESIDNLLAKLSFILDPLEIPFIWLIDTMGLEPTLVWYIAYDLLALAGVAFTAYWLVIKGMGFLKKDSLADVSDIDALLNKSLGEEPSKETTSSLSSSVGALKKNKDWQRLAEVYSALNKYKQAAKFYKKAGKPNEAAAQLSLAGKPAAAARILMKAGDFGAAGVLYMEAGKFAPAAKAFNKQGDKAGAAEAYSKASKYDEAVLLFVEYFDGPRDGQDTRIIAAEKCLTMLQSDGGKDAVSEDSRKKLLTHIGAAYELEKRYDQSAQLYRSCGEFQRAGEVYILAGKLQEAAQCMKDAGKPKEANRIGGRYYESISRWKEAGMAYMGADEWLKAGECFGKAKESVSAAENFAKGKAYAHAGFFFHQAGRFKEAVPMLQNVPEEDKQFDATRALLGRCFYELHDYGHCAATLENHLLGKRVEKGNMDYFYMLALAHEQQGNLKESKNLLMKIGGVNKNFRDLGERVSSIDSRISLMESSISSGIGSAGPGGGSGSMGMVENTLGDRYVFLKELGKGGMGVVYLAKDKQLDRQVALKFLGSLVDDSDEFRQRFIREARTAARINHPNIVAIYDISASEGKAYIAMEYIEGQNLYRHIQSKGKLKVPESLNYMVQVCNALAAIHEAGIVHRDIKPENIVLAKGGLVKLMDFGLAKADDARMTKANVIMGTPCYMSPEQAKGKDVDGRSDIYAMGLILYEMLTGEILFKDGDILNRQISEIPPKLSEVAENIPPELDRITEKCVAKDPDKRYQTGTELANDLRGVPV